MQGDLVDERLSVENDTLRLRLEEAEATIEAIRKGEVDAVVVSGANGNCVYTLQGADQFYRVLIEAMQQGAATLRGDGTILYCNHSFAAMLNMPQEKVSGTSLHSFMLASDVPSWQAMLRAARTTSSRGEVSLLPRSGTPMPVHLALNSLPLGGAMEFGLIVTDLTEQKRHEETARCLAREEAARSAAEKTAREARRAENAIRDSEARLRRLANALPQIVWMARPDGYVDYYNERWYEFTGFERGQGGDQSWWPILHPDDAQRSHHTWYAAVRSGDLYQTESRFKDRRTGGYRWHLTRAIPVRDEQGAIVRWFGTCTDIHEQKRTQEAYHFLAEASAALATLVDYESTLQKVANLAVPYFADWSAVDVVDDGGSLRRLAVAHLDPGKIELSQRLMRLYPPDPAGSGPLGQVLRTGKSVLVEEVSQEVLSREANDEAHFALLQALGLKSFICVPLIVSGKAAGVLTFATAESGRRYSAVDLSLADDLAHRAAIAVENARLYRVLQEADRKKDEFLAVLAHELRNPLAPIRNALQIMRLTSINPETRAEVRDMIERQVQQMSHLVDDLLDVSRITTGKIDLHKELLDVSTIVLSALETSQPLIEAARHQLTITPPAQPLYVEGDSTRLAQVLANLLTNSAKYTPEGGRIWVTMRREGAEAVIQVRDNGLGIPPDMLPKIFDMFTQVDRNLGRSQGGLGIGLMIVRNLVEMHGGTIKAHSGGPGKGSEFVVRLPLSQQKPNDPPGDGASDIKTLVVDNSPKHRILVVDDNVDSAESLGLMLRLAGNDVRTAYNGPAALTAAAGFHPDVVLLDIGLPGMDGYEVARRLRRIPTLDKVVLIAQTGWGQEEDRRRSSEAGFDHHFVKPIDPPVLEKLLADLPKPV